MTLSRRHFLTAASVGAIAAGGVVAARLGPRVHGVFAPKAGDAPRDILVSVFLRFGCDGLTMVPPADSADYHDSRPTIALKTSGPKAALPLGTLGGVPFFLHPNAPELKGLYDAGRLAVVHAAGLPTESRSHFISQDKMDRGVTDGEPLLQGGWLARHIQARNLSLPGLGAVSCAPAIDVALQGYGGAMAVPDIKIFNIVGGDANRQVINRLNTGTDMLTAVARETVTTIETVQARLATLSPETGGGGYGTGPLSASLKSLAATIKLDLGLEVATVDYGGWDHHVDLNAQFPSQTQELSQALYAFWNDMHAYQDRLTIVTMTEFGRRVKENANGGVDHGAASFMFALGHHINGGRLYGQWPGLKAGDLHAGDLAVTTDYRQVLQEILVKCRGEITPQAVFPTLPYKPLGLVVGT